MAGHDLGDAEIDRRRAGDADPRLDGSMPAQQRAEATGPHGREAGQRGGEGLGRRVAVERGETGHAATSRVQAVGSTRMLSTTEITASSMSGPVPPRSAN